MLLNNTLTILDYLTFDELKFRLYLIWVWLTRSNCKAEVGGIYHPIGNKKGLTKIVDMGDGWVRLCNSEGKNHTRSRNGFEKNFILCRCV